MTRLNWQKSWWIFDYGFDDSFKTGIIFNRVSVAVSIGGYWAGFSW
jgi:hypothetical protein